MGTTNFALILSPAQMFVFAFVVMLYIPCIATISVLFKELGSRRTLIIIVTEIGLAITVGGILYRILMLF